MSDGEAAFVRLRRRLLALAFVDEFGPLYAVYFLWFDDHGLTTAQVSNAFILWAVAVVVLEVPSGALADRVDRRFVLAGAFVLRVLGIVVWMCWPTHLGLMLGAVSWALHDATASGSWEAMIYDELAALGLEDRYAALVARLDQATFVGTALSALLAMGLIALGLTIADLGWMTAAIAALTVPMVATLPTIAAKPQGDGDSASGLRGWWNTLREGVLAARGDPVVRRLVALGALIEAVFVFDEYAPLLARVRGATDGVVPIFVVLIWIGLFVGAEIAARYPRARPVPLGVALGLCGVALVVAMLSPWLVAVAAIGGAYLVLQTTAVVAEARMQDVIAPNVRATVSSVRGFVGALVSAGIFLEVGQVGELWGDGDPGLGLAVAAVLVVFAGFMVCAWLPRAD